VKRPDGKTDEEIIAEVEKKVVQMIDNYTQSLGMCQKNLEVPRPRQSSL
jgi:hypothetical protein